MKVVCLGDSLTSGYGVRPSESWFYLISKMSNITFLNKGLNGDTTEGMSRRFKRDVILEKPDIVMIMGGTNDLFLNKGLHTICEHVVSMIQWGQTERILPILGIPIPLHTPPIENEWTALGDFKKVNEALLEFRTWILKYKESNRIKVIDLYGLYEEALEEEDQNGSLRGYERFYLDGVHPSAEGHQRIAQRVYHDILSCGMKTSS